MTNFVSLDTLLMILILSGFILAIMILMSDEKDGDVIGGIIAMSLMVIPFTLFIFLP